MTPRVMGLDMSLTGTGLAVDGGQLDGKPLTTTITLDPAPRRSMDRIDWIAEQVIKHCYDDGGHGQTADLIVVEDYAFSRGGHAHEIGELGGVVKSLLRAHEITYVLVGPSALKKYATGKGNADKTAMALAAFKRAGIEFSDDNCCDAWWLRMMGFDALGVAWFDLPAEQRKVLSGIDWPELVTS